MIHCRVQALLETTIGARVEAPSDAKGRAFMLRGRRVVLASVIIVGALLALAAMFAVFALLIA